jgi:hypothetical protein
MRRIIPLLFLPVFAQASLLASGGSETLINNDTEAVHKFTSDGTFTLFADATVRILVVGGGGGGGGDCAAGGGGGGVIDTNDVRLVAGRYAITVGAGGVLGSTTRIKGSNGGDSVVTRIASDGTETELFRAYGGGGGGAWDNGAGLDGGCGGGGWGSPGHGVPGQGYDSSADSGPGAGGGAGGSPVAANVGDGSGGQHQTDGGPGRASDITGMIEYYGPGGGGGGFNGFGGLGGDQTTLATEGWIWGCGWSHNNAQTDAQMTANGQKQDGRDGYGGGGGGSSNTHYAGGMGGSGCVIVRLANELTSPEPMVGMNTIAPSWFSVEIPAVVSFAGAGSTSGDVALSMQLSGDASDFGADGSFAGTETLLDAHFFGSATFTVPDLKPAHGYFVRLVARNDAGGVAWTSVAPFSTLAQAETQWIAADGRKAEDGLLMYRYNSAGFSDWAEPADGFFLARETFTAALSSGGNGKYGIVYVAPDGTQWKFPSGVSDWYDTWMWMEAGHQYNFFAGKFADNLRFYLDDELFYTQRSYNSAAVFSTTPEETGWRHVRIWFGGSTGGCGAWAGFAYGFGWNMDGATTVSGSPGTADWSMFGIDDGAILKTMKPGRDVSIAGYAPDGDDLVFSVALTSGTAAAVGAVWAAAYPADPDDTNAWANAAAIGAAGAASQTLSATVPASAKYARFYALQSDGTLCWSPTAQIDLTAVSIASLGATADGDTGTFSVRVGSVGTGTFSLALEIADNAAMAGARTIAIDASAPGDYAVTTNVVAGATTYYRFVGTTTDGGHDQTAVASFTTLGGTVLPETPSVSANNRTITVTMPTLSFGAGVQSFHVLYGSSTDESQWETETAVVVAPRIEGGYAVSFARPEMPQTWYFRLVSENVAPGGTSWTSQTGVLSATTKDDVTYRWKTDVPEGSWTDSACWTISSSDGLGTGFPSNSICKVAFHDNTVATIHVPAGTYPTATYSLSADGSHIVLVGEGRGASVLSGDGYGGTMRGETFEIRAMTLMEGDRFDNTIGEYGDRRESTNAVFRVADGGYVHMGTSYQNIRGTNAAIRVEGGSELYMGDLNPLRFNGAGETLLVDDSLYTAYNILIDALVSLGPQTARFAGKGAKATILSGLFADATDRAAVHDFTLFFELPSGGYTNGPVLFSAKADGDARPFGTMRNAGSTAKFIVAADPSALKNGGARSAKCFLVAWRAGIDPNGVELADGDGYTLSYTYGWDAEANLPAGLAEPENKGDLPTGIWCYAPSKNGTMLLVK